MEPFTMSIIADVISAAMFALLVAQWRQLKAFRAEQKAVNEANAMANRSLQRDVIYRYFHRIVECGEKVTPEEYEHVSRCADAYFANEGNGVGKVMWDKIEEHVVLDTGRE